MRKWVTAYRFPTMPEQVGAYFRVAFEASRDDFAESGSFAGGKTRSTHKKLQLSLVPEFDSDVKLEKLRELEDSLRETKGRIQNLDSKVDEIVYEMYGLAESEIAKIEKAAE